MDAIHAALWRLAKIAASNHDGESFAMAQNALKCLPVFSLQPPRDSITAAKEWLDREIVHPENTTKELACFLESYAFERARVARDEESERCIDIFIRFEADRQGVDEDMMDEPDPDWEEFKFCIRTAIKSVK